MAKLVREEIQLQALWCLRNALIGQQAPKHLRKTKKIKMIEEMMWELEEEIESWKHG